VVIADPCPTATPCFEHISASKQNVIAGGHPRSAIRSVQRENRSFEKDEFEDDDDGNGNENENGDESEAQIEAAPKPKCTSFLLTY
jgi:hypothetical protein